MRLLDHLKIVWKIALIVAVLGATLVGTIAYGTSQLLATAENHQELSAEQSAASNLQRAQRRAESRA